jgi:hypothetical protein
MNEQQLGNVLCLVCHPAGSHQNSHCHRIKTPIVILSEAKDYVFVFCVHDERAPVSDHGALALPRISGTRH